MTATSGRPACFSRALRPSTSKTRPNRCTGITALTSGVSLPSASSASSRKLSARMSQNTGRAPARLTASAEAKKLNVGTSTASPGPTPSARRASSSASVPLLQPTTNLTPR